MKKIVKTLFICLIILNLVGCKQNKKSNIEEKINVINEVKENTKIRYAELIYSGIQYAYITSMYVDGSITPSLEDIKINFKVDGINNEDIKISNDSLIIKSDEGIYCKVINIDIGFKVVCKSSNSKIDKLYLEKTIK